MTLEVLNPDNLWTQPLSGGVKVDVGAPTNSWSTLLCYTSVTLVDENGGNIPAGTYYLAVKPIDFAGDVLLSIRNAENKIYVKKRKNTFFQNNYLEVVQVSEQTLPKPFTDKAKQILLRNCLSRRKKRVKPFIG